MKETEMKTNLSAEDIKQSMANTSQITFEVTDRCNLKCEYCGYGKFYNDYDKRESKNLPTEDAVRLFRYLASLMYLQFARHQ
jgi:uncharacterized protein